MVQPFPKSPKRSSFRALRIIIEIPLSIRTRKPSLPITAPALAAWAFSIPYLSNTPWPVLASLAAVTLTSIAELPPSTPNNQEPPPDEERQSQ